MIAQVPVDIDTNVKTKEEAIAAYKDAGYAIYEPPFTHVIPRALQRYSWDFAAIRGDRKALIILGTPETREKLKADKVKLGELVMACDKFGYAMDYFNVPG
jgi:hypothetical protein